MPAQLIVLVEDNPDDQTLTLRALKKQNLANDIIVLNDGVEALAFLLDPEKPLPHLVLLDLKLPKLDGLQLLRRLRSEPRTQLLPVVVLTSSDEDRDVIEGYRLGANSYIRKPVDFNSRKRCVNWDCIGWCSTSRRRARDDARLTQDSAVRPHRSGLCGGSPGTRHAATCSVA